MRYKLSELCDYDEGYTKADADEIGWCRTSCGNTKCEYHPKHHKCPRCGHEFDDKINKLEEEL